MTEPVDNGSTSAQAVPAPPNAADTIVVRGYEGSDAERREKLGAELAHVVAHLSPDEDPEAVIERVLRNWIDGVYVANPSLKRHA